MRNLPKIDEEQNQKYAVKILEGTLVEGFGKDIEPCILQQDNQVKMNDIILRNN